MASNRPDNLNEGLPEHRGLDAEGRAAALRRLEPRKPVVGGSLADLQRMGADAIADGNTEEGSAFQVPPGETTESVDHPADDDAKAGLVTAETDRAGISEDVAKDMQALRDEQQLRDDKGENKGKEATNVVDPGSESPKAEKK